MSGEILTRKALNRALLARQHLLQREKRSPLEVIEHLVGLQAQQARPPFVGLWSRIEGFRRRELLELIEQRAVVRASLMRCTLHLMSRADYQLFRPALQPALTGAMRSILRDRLQSFDLDAVVAEARALFLERPRNFNDLRAELIRRFPDADERAMGYAMRTQIPLVIVSEEHDWGYRADGDFALSEQWLGEPPHGEERAHELVLRYLAAFGPASASDVQAWSALFGIAAVLEELRPQLVTFRDERKRELFDLPDAPRPPEGTPVRARFVADFDNLILSHADRTRVIADEHRPTVITKNGMVLPTILVDGFVAGTWKVTTIRKTAVLTVSPFAPIPPVAREELEVEGQALVRFLEPSAAHHRLEIGS
jgi:hypothetical protein